MYTGDEGEALIGVTMDTTAVARERITSIVEWYVSLMGHCIYVTSVAGYVELPTLIPW